jgi:hypothetical protein
MVYIGQETAYFFERLRRSFKSGLMFNCLLAKGRTMIHFRNTNKYSVLKLTYSYLHSSYSMCKKIYVTTLTT